MLNPRSISLPDYDGDRLLRLPNGTYTWLAGGRWSEGVQRDPLTYLGVPPEGVTSDPVDLEDLSDEEILRLCDSRDRREREDEIALMRAARIRPGAPPPAARPEWLTLPRRKIRISSISSVLLGDDAIVRVWHPGGVALVTPGTPEEAQREYERISALLGE